MVLVPMVLVPMVQVSSPPPSVLSSTAPSVVPPRSPLPTRHPRGSPYFLSHRLPRFQSLSSTNWAKWSLARWGVFLTPPTSPAPTVPLPHPSQLARELAAFNLTITEACADHRPEVVKKAICDELASLITDTGSLEPAFTTEKQLPMHLLLQHKTDTGGKNVKTKARVVLGGNCQNRDEDRTLLPSAPGCKPSFYSWVSPTCTL